MCVHHHWLSVGQFSAFCLEMITSFLFLVHSSGSVSDSKKFLAATLTGTDWTRAVAGNRRGPKPGHPRSEPSLFHFPLQGIVQGAQLGSEVRFLGKESQTLKFVWRRLIKGEPGENTCNLGGSRTGRRGKVEGAAVLGSPPAVPQAPLERGWPFRVVAVEDRWRGFRTSVPTRHRRRPPPEKG